MMRGLKSYKKKPSVSIVDLASSQRLTDRAILNANPKHAKSWHRLTLTNCCRITDQSLKWIGKYCQNLMSLNLAYCHLLTDQGVRTILAKCTQLSHLWLDGIEELSDFVPEGIHFNLQSCSLKGAPHIQGKTLARFFVNSPHLIDWSASMNNATGADLMEMSRSKKRCTQMTISQGTTIQDHALNALLSCQQELQEIHIEEFPELKNPCFSRQKNLRYLHISNCLELTDSFFESLIELPLVRLRIHHCPKITQKGLLILKQKPNLPIFLSECSGISSTEIRFLSTEGVKIY